MGIRFSCAHCGKRLNIKTTQAGKTGNCPHCRQLIEIPLQSSRSSKRSTPLTPVPAPDSFLLDKPLPTETIGQTDPISDAPDRVWYFRCKQLGERGPFKSRQMRQELVQGDLTADCTVWRDDWGEWHLAGDVFPQLAEQEPKRVGEKNSSNRMASKTMLILAVLLLTASGIAALLWILTKS